MWGSILIYRLHDQLQSRRPWLNNFTGTYVFDLKRAIEAQEKPLDAASSLKLFVKKPDGGGIEDLDELEDLHENEDFNFTPSTTSKKKSNPISVELPRK